jgi:hypothetical protein
MDENLATNDNHRQGNRRRGPVTWIKPQKAIQRVPPAAVSVISIRVVHHRGHKKTTQYKERKNGVFAYDGYVQQMKRGDTESEY